MFSGPPGQVSWVKRTLKNKNKGKKKDTASAEIQNVEKDIRQTLTEGKLELLSDKIDLKTESAARDKSGHYRKIKKFLIHEKTYTLFCTIFI